jgi:hypothetical protein
MDAPTAKPSVAIDSRMGYYVARADVQKPGAVYYSPPVITFSTSDPQPLGKGKVAKAKAYLSQSGVSEIRVEDGGKYYPSPPSISLSDTHGKGAIIEAVLAGFPEPEECDDAQSGLSQWSVTESPEGDYTDANTIPRFAGLDRFSTEIEIVGDGTFSVQGRLGLPPEVGARGSYVHTRESQSVTCGSNGPHPMTRGYTNTLSYTVSGAGSGTCAKLRIVWSGAQWRSSCSFGLGGYQLWSGATGISEVQVVDRGQGFAPDASVRVVFNSIAGDSESIVIEGYGAENPNNTDSKTYSVQELVIKERGSGYVVAPFLQIVSNSGFGAYGTCTVKDGKIDTVTLENCGGGYKSPPEVKLLSGGAEAFAVARPHFRGKYQCYYRYVDGTPEDRGGPIPSSLSPVNEVDCGEGASGLTWGVSPPPENVVARLPVGKSGLYELWRTTANQALTLYRVTVSESTSFFDDLTDDELRDEDRTHYAVMPIVLPNGELNADRFTPPPSDRSAVVRFQDRFWYGVDTSGKSANSILFSEVDEPESVPDVNEIVLQQNARDADVVSALIPYGSTLLVMQKRHSYSLTFSRQPLLDAQVTPIAYRGCLNQRCWDIHDGICYVLDQQGVYSVSSGGDVQPLSTPIQDIFRTQISFANGDWYFLSVDPTSNTLRAFVSLASDGAGGYPSLALCYSLDTKAWWMERYPQRITCGTTTLMSTGDFCCLYGGRGGVYLLGRGEADMARGAIVTVALTERGSGYRSPPKVMANGGVAASFQASVDADGQLSAIWISNAGHSYPPSGSLYIEPPNDPDCHDPVQATAAFTATPLATDTPTFVQYAFKTGNAAFPTDASNARAGSDSSRSVSMTYAPQSARCEAAIRMYYNNSTHPRKNVAFRDRGTGVVHSVVDNAVRLDFGRAPGGANDDNGVRTALFAGRSLDDMSGSDRHVSVEIVGARTGGAPVIIHTLDVYGTAGD